MASTHCGLSMSGLRLPCASAVAELRWSSHKEGGSWRDQEHKKFVDQFEQHMRGIARFTESSNAYVPYLLRKAEHIEDYLQS